MELNIFNSFVFWQINTMSTLITTRSPSSYQLRLATFSCRKYPSSSIFLRMRVHKLAHPIHCSSNSRDNVSKRRTGSKFSVNAFSGWSGDDNGTEVLNESPPKKGSYGGRKWLYSYLIDDSWEFDLSIDVNPSQFT